MFSCISVSTFFTRYKVLHGNSFTCVLLLPHSVSNIVNHLSVTKKKIPQTCIPDTEHISAHLSLSDLWSGQTSPWCSTLKCSSLDARRLAVCGFCPRLFYFSFGIVRSVSAEISRRFFTPASLLAPPLLVLLRVQSHSRCTFVLKILLAKSTIWWLWHCYCLIAGLIKMGATGIQRRFVIYCSI